MSRECDEQEMIEEHDLRYVWRCPKCHWEYEDTPGTNEALPCNRCGTQTQRDGETYM